MAKASVDEFGEALQTCTANGITVSVTFHVFEIWKTSEQMASTENFVELLNFFCEKNAYMASLERLASGAHALLVLVASGSFYR